MTKSAVVLLVFFGLLLAGFVYEMGAIAYTTYETEQACAAIPCPNGDHAFPVKKPSGVVRCVCAPDPDGTVLP